MHLPPALHTLQGLSRSKPQSSDLRAVPFRRADFAGFAKDNGAFCTSLPVGAEVMGVLERETLKADPAALAKLMADHTQVSLWRGGGAGEGG